MGPTVNDAPVIRATTQKQRFTKNQLRSCGLILRIPCIFAPWRPCVKFLRMVDSTFHRTFFEIQREGSLGQLRVRSRNLNAKAQKGKGAKEEWTSYGRLFSSRGQRSRVGPSTR